MDHYIIGFFLDDVKRFRISTARVIIEFDLQCAGEIDGGVLVLFPVDRFY